MGIKLKNGIVVRERGGKRSPSPTWRFGPVLEDSSVPHGSIFLTSRKTSARKFGASFWESQPQVKMTSKASRVLRRKQNHKDEIGFEVDGDDDAQLAMANNSSDHQGAQPYSPPHLPESASSLRRRVTASLIQHHSSVQRNGKNLLPVSPASYTSSVELEPHNHAVTPASSLDFGGRIRESGYNLKSSTELVKILNRIWTLEEQQASNISLIQALSRERDLSRAKIKNLMRERKSDRQEINTLKKQIRSIQSVNGELEDERKLRKHSESLHRKLARELSEAKSSILKMIKELEREKRARVLLENLCDEFAKGIRDYEQEQRFSKQNPEKDLIKREHHPDRLILHVSEAWLDERIQMKLAEARCDFSEKSCITDKLSHEIETFLQAKQKSSVGPEHNDEICSKKHKENRSRRHSLESLHLNEAGYAPKSGVYGEDSIDIGYCFELNHGLSGKQKNGSYKLNGESARTLVKSNSTKKQVRPREQREENSVEVKNENSEISQEDLKDSKSNQVGAQAHELNSTYDEDGLISSALEGIEDSLDLSETAGRNTTVREWMSRITAADPDVCESSSKWPTGIKENTLKAKLLEARLENQQLRSRTVKGSF